MSDMEKGKYLALGKRIAWAQNPDQRRFARQLVLEGNGPKKIAAALNKRFGLSINGNSLGGFIFAHKGNKDGPTYFLELLSDGEQVPARTTKKKVTSPVQARREPRNVDAPVPPPSRYTPPVQTSEFDIPPSPVEFNYEEYLRMSLRQERHAPGNAPLRMKVSAKREKK